MELSYSRRYLGKPVESFIIVASGLFLHLQRISIIDLRYSTLPMLVPNVASCIFLFSVLCCLAKVRPFWPSGLRRPPRLLIFLMDFTLIMYAADLVMRQMWVPSLRFLNFLCEYMGQYVIVGNQSFLANSAPALSRFLRYNTFYVLRFLLAVIVFIVMVDTTGILDYFRLYTKNSQSRLDLFASILFRGVERDAAPSLSDSNLLPDFDINELPPVPHEDLLLLGYRGRGRRGRSLSRRGRRPKLLLDGPENACTC